MKLFAILLCFFLSYIPTQAQVQISPSLVSKDKPPIDSAAIVNWPLLGAQVAISGDGKYFMYTIDNQPAGCQTMFVQSTDNEWKREFININNGFFSADSKWFIFQSKDTLYYLVLGKSQINILTGIHSYKQANTGKEGWLAYLLNTNNQELVLCNLHTGKKRLFTGVIDYAFAPLEKALLLKTRDTFKHDTSITLQLVTLPQTAVNTIWSSKNNNNNFINIIGFQFDHTGDQLTFMTTDTSIWYYHVGQKTAIVKATNQNAVALTGLSISLETPYFESNDKCIFFNLLKPISKLQKFENEAVNVEIWSYKDSVLPFLQKPQTSFKSYLGAIQLEAESILRVEMENEGWIGGNGEFALIQDRIDIPISEYWWPSYTDKSYWLINLKNGKRRKLCSVYDWSGITFSPDGKYMVYFDNKKKRYYSNYLPSAKCVELSAGIQDDQFQLHGKEYPFKASPPYIVGEAGWLVNKHAILLYDDFDIWQLDLEGKAKAINLTNGYGKKNGIKFRIVNPPNGIVFSHKEDLLLAAFNTKNKYNGFCLFNLDRDSDSIPLIMGPWASYYGSTAASMDSYTSQMPPLKATNAPIWLVKRETAMDAANYFLTTNFKNYKALTKLQPQKKYNWLNTELVSWLQLDNTPCQGVLYKPENFNPNKKYPLIFTYYEEMSQNVYQFPKPGFAEGRLDIPWYVSRGYLVFTPDIYYGIASVTGKVNGDYVVNSVVSAVHYLASLPYVDTEKIGIQGHSFGGGETLYLITHSNLFAAACAAAPTVSNEITTYLGIVRANGKPVTSKMAHSEIGHNKIGATLWQRPDLYIQASPVFRANQTTTPLLLMHNLADPVCDWGQSVEIFMALRRLKKEVWLLQYEHGSHTLHGKESIDYTKRMEQFFDHYLKNTPLPEWMK